MKRRGLSLQEGRAEVHIVSVNLYSYMWGFDYVLKFMFVLKESFSMSSSFPADC